MSLDNQFNNINDKLQLLLKQQARLKKENEWLHHELESLRHKEEGYKEHIEKLEQRISVLKLSVGEMNEKEKKEFERKLNQYLKEIEKCIAFLSQ